MGRDALLSRVCPCHSGCGHGDQAREVAPATDTGHPVPAAVRRPPVSTDAWIMLAAVVAPIAVAAVLIPWRTQLDTADTALFLVVVIVAVASTGRRLAAATAALVAALSFDFFLTRPYQSFRITSHSDFITEILLLVVGLAVGELAARGRRHRDAAWQGRHQMALLHSVTELAATGKDPQVVVATAAAEITELLFLRDCRFTAHGTDRAVARVTPDGTSPWARRPGRPTTSGCPATSTSRCGAAAGCSGTSSSPPRPGKPVSSDRLLVAVAIADQVGVALASRGRAEGCALPRRRDSHRGSRPPTSPSLEDVAGSSGARSGGNGCGVIRTPRTGTSRPIRPRSPALRGGDRCRPVPAACW